MLPVEYVNLQYNPVEDIKALVKETGLNKLLGLYNEAIRLFSVKGGNLILSMSVRTEPVNTVFKYSILGEDYKKSLIGELIYIPSQRRMDIWIPGLPQPMIQFKERKAIFKNYALLLDRVEIDKSFEKLYTQL